MFFQLTIKFFKWVESLSNNSWRWNLKVMDFDHSILTLPRKKKNTSPWPKKKWRPKSHSAARSMRAIACWASSNAREDAWRASSLKTTTAGPAPRHSKTPRPNLENGPVLNRKIIYKWVFIAQLPWLHTRVYDSLCVYGCLSIWIFFTKTNEDSQHYDFGVVMKVEDWSQS